MHTNRTLTKAKLLYANLAVAYKPPAYKSYAFAANLRFASTASLANLRFAYKSVAFVSRWFVRGLQAQRSCAYKSYAFVSQLCKAEQARVSPLQLYADRTLGFAKQTQEYDRRRVARAVCSVGPCSANLDGGRLSKDLLL